MQKLADDEFDMQQVGGFCAEIKGQSRIMQAFLAAVGTRPTFGFPSVLAVLNGRDDERNLAPIEGGGPEVGEVGHGPQGGGRNRLKPHIGFEPNVHVILGET